VEHEASNGDRQPLQDELSHAPLVRTERGLGLPRRPVTALFLHGEHDFGSRELVGEALAGVHTDVLVDLSWCTFIDSSIIAMLLTKHAELEDDGYRLELIVPPTHVQLSRTFDRLGARRLVAVHDAPPSVERLTP
jgi:anti-anti-sigma regulatory factor